MKPWITYLLCFIVTATWAFVQLDYRLNNIGFIVFTSLGFNLVVVLITQHRKTTKEKIIIYLKSILISLLGLLTAGVVFALIMASIGKIGG